MLRNLMLMSLLVFAACGTPGGSGRVTAADGSSPTQTPTDATQPTSPVSTVETTQTVDAGDASSLPHVALQQAFTLNVVGPQAAETGAVNPFLDYRLDVTFEHAGRKVVVPGYFAADGSAAESGAAAGTAWRAHFVPDAPGEWKYTVSFRTGAGVALAAMGTGTADGPHGKTGAVVAVAPAQGHEDTTGGPLRYVGKRYLRRAVSGAYFIKAGVNSPENLLAFGDFDQTSATHRYAPHAADWHKGDPEWQGGKGHGLIGALNYLASQGVNSIYFLTMNVTGDGNDVWPWTSKDERFRFDVSKLAQWEAVFSHADRLGVALHVITQETENDQLLDGGALGNARKLYYRELVARFAHHAGVTWNLGEENTNTAAQRDEFAAYLRGLDPYDHPIQTHTYPKEQELVFGPQIGNPDIEGASLQLDPISLVHPQTQQWIKRSTDAGRPWVVAIDEIGPSYDGLVPDSVDPNHDGVRAQVLWGNLMAGGGGVEWYFGYQHANNDLNAEDFRPRERMYAQTKHAVDFFQKYLPFATMDSRDDLVPAGLFCLAAPGKTYAVYRPRWGSAGFNLNVGSDGAKYTVDWYNPRDGGALAKGSVTMITATGGQVSLGMPPGDASQDWAVLVRRQQ